jgi:hypothetical protein
MPDCHVETYTDKASLFRHRAVVIHTESGRKLYTTWPYQDESKAVDRARRWMNEEYRRADAVGSGLLCQRTLFEARQT